MHYTLRQITESIINYVYFKDSHLANASNLPANRINKNMYCDLSNVYHPTRNESGHRSSKQLNHPVVHHLQQSKHFDLTTYLRLKMN